MASYRAPEEPAFPNRMPTVPSVMPFNRRFHCTRVASPFCDSWGRLSMGAAAITMGLAFFGPAGDSILPPNQVRWPSTIFATPHCRPTRIQIPAEEGPSKEIPSDRKRFAQASGTTELIAFSGLASLSPIPAMVPSVRTRGADQRTLSLSPTGCNSAASSCSFKLQAPWWAPCVTFCETC